MSEMAKKARADNKAKAKRLSMPTTGKIDASTWTPDEPLNADVKTGMRPISPRAFKNGGLVTELVNRNDKEANEARPGKKHVGGMKKGGAAHSDAAEDKALIKKMVKPAARTERASGGRTGKGKTNINILINAGGKPDQTAGAPGIPPGLKPPPMPMMPPGGPGGAPPMPSGMPMGGAGGPPGLPPGMGMPMPRQRGGRTNESYMSLKGGAGSGLGRLQKAHDRARGS